MHKSLVHILHGIESVSVRSSGVPGGGWVFGWFNPPEIPKALQNSAKLNPIVKTVKNG